MKVKVNNATAEFGHIPCSLFYKVGPKKSHSANEIARELLRNGKSVSKESYYVIILVCANKRGGGRGWSASGFVLFIAIVNNYEHRQRGLVAHLNGINQKFLKCLTFLANKLLYFNNSRLYSYFPSMRIPNFVILLILLFPSVV